VDACRWRACCDSVSARRERFRRRTAVHIAHAVDAGSFCGTTPRTSTVGRSNRASRRLAGNVLLGRAGESSLPTSVSVRSEFVDRRTYPGELKGKVGYMSPDR